MRIYNNQEKRISFQRWFVIREDSERKIDENVSTKNKASTFYVWNYLLVTKCLRLNKEHNICWYLCLSKRNKILRWRRVSWLRRHCGIRNRMIFTYYIKVTKLSDEAYRDEAYEYKSIVPRSNLLWRSKRCYVYYRI